MGEESKSGQHPVLRWGALALGGLLWGAGVAAMYGDDYKLAHVLYFVGIAIMAADLAAVLGEYSGHSRRKRICVAVGAGLLAFGLSVAWIQLRKADIRSGAAVPMYATPFQILENLISESWHWLLGPHGRWFDKLLGAVYAILALLILLFTAAVVKLIKRQKTSEGKGFLDYKLDAETAMQKMPRILEKLTRIMNEVSPTMNKHTAALLRAKSTAGQLRVSRAAALSLDRYSMRVDSIGKEFVENGRLLSEGLLGWSTWIKTAHPNKAVFGTFPDLLKRLTGTMGTANSSLTGYIASTMTIKGVSSVLNAAVDRHVASWNVILQTSKRTFEACNSTLAVLDGLS